MEQARINLDMNKISNLFPEFMLRRDLMRAVHALNHGEVPAMLKMLMILQRR